MLNIIIKTGDNDVSDEYCEAQVDVVLEELTEFMKNELEGGTDDLSESQ